MHVAIDITALRFTHIHRVREIVWGLTVLECAPIKSILYDSTERPEFLDGLGAAQLTAIYLNAVGQVAVTTDQLVLREALALYAESVLPMLVDETELERQIASVEDKLRSPVNVAPHYRYTLGAKVPALATEDKFTFATRKLAFTLADEAAKRAPQRRATRPAVAAPAAATPPVAPAPRAERSRSSVRPVIWSVADKLWGEAGKPTAILVVLELRKKMMNELETEHGVKRTTASCTLGEWMKDRLSQP